MGDPYQILTSIYQNQYGSFQIMRLLCVCVVFCCCFQFVVVGGFLFANFLLFCVCFQFMLFFMGEGVFLSLLLCFCFWRGVLFFSFSFWGGGGCL